MKEKTISNFKNNLYQVAIILLLAYAAFSTAMRDLDRLQEVAANVQAATSAGLGSLAKVYSATKSLAEAPELARVPQPELTESPRVGIVAAGGSVALTGLNVASSTKPSCPVLTRTLSKPVDKNLNWNVVAQVPKQVRFLRDAKISVDRNAEVATLMRRGPKLRAMINKIPREGRDRWVNVDEFKSLSDVVGFAFKVAHKEDAEKEPTVETTEAASPYFYELRRGISDSETDNLETHE